jgi:hypothetical protein
MGNSNQEACLSEEALPQEVCGAMNDDAKRKCDGGIEQDGFLVALTGMDKHLQRRVSQVQTTSISEDR